MLSCTSVLCFLFSPFSFWFLIPFFPCNFYSPLSPPTFSFRFRTLKSLFSLSTFPLFYLRLSLYHVPFHFTFSSHFLNQRPSIVICLIYFFLFCHSIFSHFLNILISLLSHHTSLFFFVFFLFHGVYHRHHYKSHTIKVTYMDSVPFNSMQNNIIVWVSMVWYFVSTFSKEE